MIRSDSETKPVSQVLAALVSGREFNMDAALSRHAHICYRQYMDYNKRYLCSLQRALERAAITSAQMRDVSNYSSVLN
jgi:hypothetical protein